MPGTLWVGVGLASEHRDCVRAESMHEERGFTLQTDATEGSAQSSFRARTEGGSVWPEGEGDTQVWLASWAWGGNIRPHNEWPRGLPLVTLTLPERELPGKQSVSPMRSARQSLGREIEAKDLGLTVWIQKTVARNESYNFTFLPSFFF